MLNAAPFVIAGTDPQGGGTPAVIIIVFVAVLGILYWSNRRIHRRADSDYWDRRKWEEELRANDPDLKRDE